MSALRELLVEFGISVDTKELDKGNEKTDKLKSKVENLGKALAIAYVGHALVSFVEDVIESTARLNDQAEQLGVSTGELQRFQYEAKMSGVEAEGAATGLRFFTKAIGNATEGNAEALGTFQKLGVNIRDANGKVSSSTELLEGVADGFQNLKTDGERTALAMQLFGRSGAQLIPLLKQGSAGVKKLSGEFDAMGGGINDNAIKALSDADDAMDRTKFATHVLEAELVATLAPAVIEVAGFIKDGVAAFREFNQHSDFVANALGIVAAAAGIAALAWAALNFEWILMAIGAAALVLIIDDVIETFQGNDTVLKDLTETLFGAQGALSGLGKFLDHVVDGAKEAYKWFVKLLGLEDKSAAAQWNDWTPEQRAQWFKDEAHAGGHDVAPGEMNSSQLTDVANRGAALPPRKILSQSFDTKPSVPASSVGGTTSGDTAIAQTNHVAVNVNATSGDPGAVGRAAADGTRAALDDNSDDFAAILGGG